MPEITSSALPTGASTEATLSLINGKTPGAAVSTVNSTATLLAPAGVFTGTSEDVSQYSDVTVAIKTDQVGTVSVQFSTDNSNWDSQVPLTIRSTSFYSVLKRFSTVRKYFRVIITNTSANAQTFLRCQSIFNLRTILNSAGNSVLSLEADTIATRTLDPDLETSRGLREGNSAVNVFGLNASINNTTADIWGTGGTWVQPTAATTVNVVSSSPNDNSVGGTGARTLTITGLNGSYVEVSETLNLNGTVAVATSNSYWIIHTMIVATAGTGETAAGTITTVWTGGGTPVGPSIIIGANQTQFCIYQVPVATTLYIHNIQGGIQNGTNCDISLFAKPFGGVFNLKSVVALNLAGSSHSVHEFKLPLKFAAKTIIKLKGTTSNNTEVHGSFDATLIID